MNPCMKMTCMCYRTTTLRTIESHLQQCINRIEKWASNNGFLIFQFENAMCTVLSAVHDDPELYIYGSLLPVVEDFNFLFDRKLFFILHIMYLKAKCLKALN